MKQVPVCTRLIAVSCNIVFELVHPSTRPLAVECRIINASTCIYKPESRGMQHGVKLISLCTILIAVARRLMEQMTISYGM